jgi:hypothetical protein
VSGLPQLEQLACGDGRSSLIQGDHGAAGVDRSLDHFLQARIFEQFIASAEIAN